MAWLCAMVAAGITAYQLSRPGLLFGATPDISAWFGGSIRLVHGALPYRDFVFTQPPGFPLLVSPFALLSDLIGTRDALAALRLTTPLLAAAIVLLTGRVVRHRGPAATLVACGAVAVFPAEIYAQRSGLLEPVIDLLCLAGVGLAFEGDGFADRRRMAGAGVAFGVAATVKLPALLPGLVVAALCLPQAGRRLLPFAGGALAGFAIPTLPFVVVAPGAFVRDALSTPIGRVPLSGRTGVAPRLADITGAAAFGRNAVLAGAALLAIALIVTAAYLLPRRRPTPLEWFALGAGVAVAAAQLGPARYYLHYAAFVGPFLGILLGLSFSRLRWTRPGPATALATAAILAVLAAQLASIHRATGPDPLAAVTAVVPSGACALSYSPRDLVTSDRFVAASAGCNAITDPEGTALAYTDDPAAGAAVWQAAFAHSDYIVSETPVDEWFIQWTPALREYLATHFRLVRSARLFLYVRNGFPVASSG
jgi:alpha-1,2-mannosyltransferase